MGFPAVIHGVESDAWETSTTQQYPLGQKMITPRGDVFRYSEMGATVGVANKLYQSEVPTANWLGQAATTALAVGDTTIAFTDGGTAFAANLFVGGYVHVVETDDLGHCYPVKSNTASAGSAEATFTLVDGVTVQVAVAVAAGNVLSVIKSPWKDIIIHPSINTAACVGIPKVIIAANSFGWVQSRGIASCLADGSTAILIGNMVRPSEDDDGGVALRDETAAYIDYQDVGYAVTDQPPDGDFGVIFLTIE